MSYVSGMIIMTNTTARVEQIAEYELLYEDEMYGFPLQKFKDDQKNTRDKNVEYK